MSQAEIKNQLTDAEAAASNNPENPGAEQAVQANSRSYDRTRAGRIANIDKKIEELQAKRQAIIDSPEPVGRVKPAPVVVNVGDVVRAEVGRDKTRREVVGTVLAVFDKAGRTKVKLLSGEGAASELFEVYSVNILTGEADADAASE